MSAAAELTSSDPKWGHLFETLDWRRPELGGGWAKTVAFRVVRPHEEESRIWICGNCATAAETGDPTTISGDFDCERCGCMCGLPAAHESALASLAAGEPQ